MISTPQIVTQVRVFAPGTIQTCHRDDQSRVSIVLRGGIAEDANSGSARLFAGDVLLKSREVSHEDRFSQEGAAVFSVLFNGGPDCPFLEAHHEGAWRVRRDAPALRASFLLLEAAAARDVAGSDAALSDLLNCQSPTIARRSPPIWLTNLHAELELHSLAEVDVATRARSAGVHPVTASREFRRCFGLSISEHAMLHCIRRAITLFPCQEMALASIAVDAGFYDQSHMNRVFRRVLGRPPGVVRRAFPDTERSRSP